MSFLAGIYLWFIPLITIPIIFHLLKKRNYKNIQFSSLRFFKNIENKSLKRINIINILLLVIRTLLILLIILIVSKPMLNGITRGNSSDEDTYVLILIDNSYSNTRLINEKINEILKTITNIYSPSTLINIQTIDNNYLSSEFNENIKFPLKNIKSSYYSLDLNEFFEKHNKIDYSEYPNKDLYVISDFQNNLFNNIDNKSNLIDWNIFLYTHSLENDNIFLSDIHLSNEFISIDELITINITLNNISNNDYETVNSSLYINDVKVGTNTTSINASSNKILSFKTSIAESGLHNCFFETEKTKYYFNLNIPDTIKIAAIYDNYNNAKYVLSALNAYKEINKNIIVKSFTNDQFMLDNELYNSVIKFNISDISHFTLNKINAITNNLVIIPTDDLNLSLLTNYFNIDDQYTKINKTKIQNGYLSLNNDISKDDHLKKLFSKSNQGFEIYEYFKVKSSKNSVLFLSNNHTLLNRYRINDFNVDIFTIPLNITASNVPLTGAFIPLLNNLLLKSNRNISYTVGEELNIFTNTTNKKIYHKFNNTTHTYNLDQLHHNPLMIDEPGFHKFILSDEDSTYVSVNLPKIEMVDIKATNETINTYLPNFINVEEENVSEILKKQISGIHIWRYLLYIFIILILLEMYLSNIYIYKND